MELNSTVDEITRKNESVLEGNADKLKKFEQDMEKKLQVSAFIQYRKFESKFLVL